MKLIKKTVTALLCSLLFVGSAMAESRYITDVIYVPMRAGPGNQYKIVHHGLKTGTEMNVLELDAGNEFSKVVTPSGLEGYVRTQYLLKKPPARMLLPEALARADKADKDREQLLRQLKAKESELATLETKVKTTNKDLEARQVELKRVLDISSDTLAIDQRNKQLVEENQRLKNRVQILGADNDQLQQESSYRWFLYGGGTILIGIILGLLLPRIRVRKKTADWV